MYLEPGRCTQAWARATIREAEARLLLAGFFGVLFLEALDAPRGVHQLLFAGEKGMAARTNFHADHVALKCGPGFKRAAARTMHRDGVVIGMNTFFHSQAPFCRPFCPRLTASHTLASLGQS